MTKPVAPRSTAHADVKAIRNWLDTNSPPTADKFLDAIERVYTLLGEHPAIGATRHADLFPDMPALVRFHPVRGFPPRPGLLHGAPGLRGNRPRLGRGPGLAGIGRNDRLGKPATTEENAEQFLRRPA